jgi:Na+/proline symporter
MMGLLIILLIPFIILYIGFYFEKKKKTFTRMAVASQNWLMHKENP